MNRYKSVFNVLMAVLLVIGALGTLPKQQVAAFTEDLIISEYIEGSSYNKAIEIYNGTGANVNLDNYAVELYNNGVTAPSVTENLPAVTLIAGETYHIVYTQAIATHLTEHTVITNDGITSGVGNFNGDDPLVLRRTTDNAVVDSIGKIGERPGIGYWGTGSITTANDTLVRKSTICSGDSNPDDAFDPALEWDGYAQDDFSFFGTHTANCDVAVPTVTSTTPAPDATNVAINTDIVINFDVPVTVASGWFSISCTTSLAHTAVVTETSPSATYTLNPDADFGYSELCTVTIDSIKVIPPMTANYTFSFTSEAEPTEPPAVAAITPTDGAMGQERNTSFVVEFDQAVTLTELWFNVSCPASTGITFGASVVGNTYTITPSGLLAYADTCTLTITSANVRSAASNLVMAADFVSAFTVKTDDAPALVTSVPAHGAVNVAKDTPITLTFNERVDVSATGITFSCSITGNEPFVVGMTPADATTWIITYDTLLQGVQTCTLTVPATSVTDEDAIDPPDTLAADIVITFTPIDGCGDPFIPVFTLQGTGPATPYPNQTVSTEGVVVADLQAIGNKKAFYIHADPGDSDPLSSDGLMIYTGASPIAVTPGDRVRISGTIIEFSNVTEISPVSKVELCSQGQPVVAAEPTMPFSSVNLEYVEGMLVNFPQALYINDYYQFDQYGQITLGTFRHFQPTTFMEPGPLAQAEFTSYALDTISLDDGQSAQNPAFLPHPAEGRYTQGAVGPVHIFRGGDSITNLTAIVDYIGSAYRLVRVGSAQFNVNNPRVDAPNLVPGEIRVSSINTLNYFVTIDNGASICGPDGYLQACRGADTEDERVRQLEKTASALIGMDADVIGLLELENDSSAGTTAWGADYAISSIVAKLNERTSAGLYNFVPTGAIGTDAIKVGIVYRTTNVEPLRGGNGDIIFSLLTSAFDPLFDDGSHRPALAVSFKDLNTNEIFTLAVNHLKSKGSCPASGPDTDQLDGASCWNLKRTQGASALVRWLETDPNGTGSNLYLIMGDLNAYAKEDPIDAIIAGSDGIAGNADDYIDLAARFHTLHNEPGLVNYGYVFGGMAGSLDYALASKQLTNYVLDAKEWHINADEADAIDYDMTFKPLDKKISTNPMRSAHPIMTPFWFRCCSTTHPRLLMMFMKLPRILNWSLGLLVF